MVVPEVELISEDGRVITTMPTAMATVTIRDFTGAISEATMSTVGMEGGTAIIVEVTIEITTTMADLAAIDQDFITALALAMLASAPPGVAAILAGEAVISVVVLTAAAATEGEDIDRN